MATLVTLEANVGKVLSIDYTGTDKTELDQKLNDAVLDVLRRTRCYVGSTTISLTAGQTDYQLDTAILSIRTIYATAASLNYRFRQVSEQEITDLQTLSLTSSDPVRFYALIGANLLSVWPPPSTADTLTVRHVPRPTAMSAAGNDPSTSTYGGIPAEYHRALELYALWQMADSTDDSTSSQGERYRILYEGEKGNGGFIAQMRAEIYRKAGPTPVARVTRPRGRGWRQKNDQRY